jgi:hypothetical protein
MDWLSSIDLSHLWDVIVAQTPTPTPTPSPTSTPARNLSEIELLKSQLEFLKTTNGQLSESFNRFVGAMQFTLVVFAFLGGILAYIFGKNLDDAKKIAREMIRQEVDSKVNVLVQSEVENVKRTLQRERVIASTTVDYYLPSKDSEPKDSKLLQQRGFQKVRFWNQKRQPKKPFGNVIVLDLINSNILSGQDYAGLSDEEATKKREEKVKTEIDLVLNWLEPSSVLVIYVKGRFKEIDNLAARVDYYYVSANTSVTLMGIVADAAYVAYGEKNEG